MPKPTTKHLYNLAIPELVEPFEHFPPPCKITLKEKLINTGEDKAWKTKLGERKRSVNTDHICSAGGANLPQDDWRNKY